MAHNSQFATGRQLDRVAAVALFNARVICHRSEPPRKLYALIVRGEPRHDSFTEPLDPWHYVPHYSTDITAAWKIWQLMANSPAVWDNFIVTLQHFERAYSRDPHRNIYDCLRSAASHMPQAITRAALTLSPAVLLRDPLDAPR